MGKQSNELHHEKTCFMRMKIAEMKISLHIPKADQHLCPLLYQYDYSFVISNFKTPARLCSKANQFVSYLGPVVQSIVSLTTLLRSQPFKNAPTSYQIHGYFCLKNLM